MQLFLSSPTVRHSRPKHGKGFRIARKEGEFPRERQGFKAGPIGTPSCVANQGNLPARLEAQPHRIECENDSVDCSVGLGSFQVK